MPAFRVIKHLDVIEHISTCFFTSAVGFPSDAFALQQLEKAFCHGVVVTVTRYSEIHTGRATWGQFGLTVAVGAMLLVVGIWLLTTAIGVL